MNEFKYSCPHCGQHVQGDSRWRGRELLCPACQKTMVVPQAIQVPFVVPILAKLQEDELAGSLELPGWLRIVWQVVLGALTPLIVSAAMAGINFQELRDDLMVEQQLRLLLLPKGAQSKLDQATL